MRCVNLQGTISNIRRCFGDDGILYPAVGNGVHTDSCN